MSAGVTTQILVCRCHLMDMQLRVDAIMIKVIYIPDEESESKLGRATRGFTARLDFAEIR